MRCVSACLVINLFSPLALGAAQQLPPPNAVAEQTFTSLGGIRELSDGRTIVSDRAETHLTVIDWAANVSTVIGRVGDGPLEYRIPGVILALGSDSTLVLDGLGARWILMAGDRIVGSVRSQNPLYRSVPRMIGVDHLGHVLGMRGYGANNAEVRVLAADSVFLLIVDRVTERVETVARLGGLGIGADQNVRIPARNGRPMTIIGGTPLSAADQAIMFPDGWVAVARTNPYRVDWRNPNGTWTRGALLADPRTVVDDDIKCDALRSGDSFPAWLADPCDPSILPVWPEVLPPFLWGFQGEELFATSEGQLVIARTSLSGPRRYDVIDRTGRLSRTFTLGEDEHLLGFGQRSVYTVLTDDLDLQHIRRHRWP
jgi:hypothetical protein